MKHCRIGKSSTLKDDLFVGFIVVMFFSNFFGFVIGSFQSADKPCVYESLASYIPGHYVACELFRPRFHQETK